jgi:hypothetical protein
MRSNTLVVSSLPVDKDTFAIFVRPRWVGLGYQELPEATKPLLVNVMWRSHDATSTWKSLAIFSRVEFGLDRIRMNIPRPICDTDFCLCASSRWGSTSNPLRTSRSCRQTSVLTLRKKSSRIPDDVILCILGYCGLIQPRLDGFDIEA